MHVARMPRSNLLKNTGQVTSNMDNIFCILEFNPNEPADLISDYEILKSCPLLPEYTKCTHYWRLNKSVRVISHATGRKFKCIKKCTCRSTNLIYCIDCTICHWMNYVSDWTIISALYIPKRHTSGMTLWKTQFSHKPSFESFCTPINLRWWYYMHQKTEGFVGKLLDCKIVYNL